jgi:hypothetical protein
MAGVIAVLHKCASRARINYGLQEECLTCARCALTHKMLMCAHVSKSETCGLSLNAQVAPGQAQ